MQDTHYAEVLTVYSDSEAEDLWGHSLIKNKINILCKEVGSTSFFVITLITCKSQQLFQVEAFVYAVCLKN